MLKINRINIPEPGDLPPVQTWHEAQPGYRHEPAEHIHKSHLITVGNFLTRNLTTTEKNSWLVWTETIL